MTAIGITLPSFRRAAEPALAVADAAEAAGLDGVFAYDHLFRRAADGTRRPALEMFALLGAVAAETRRIALGSLVARATLRPAATLAVGFDTVCRIAGSHRLVAAIGAGDGESREENESFGVAFGTMHERVDALRDAVLAARDRGYPVWVGGRAGAVRALAAGDADGWNSWGTRVDTFRRYAEACRTSATRSPFTVSWGGLVVLGDDDSDADAKARRLGARAGTIVGGPARVAEALRAYVDAGADWLVIGPVDSSDPANATRLGDLVAPRLR